MLQSLSSGGCLVSKIEILPPRLTEEDDQQQQRNAHLPVLNGASVPPQAAPSKCRIVRVVVAAAAAQIRCRADFGAKAPQSIERPAVVKQLQIDFRSTPVQCVDVRLATHLYILILPVPSAPEAVYRIGGESCKQRIVRSEYQLGPGIF